MTDDIEKMVALLSCALKNSEIAKAQSGFPVTVTNLRRLSGGANMETWAFSVHFGDRFVPLILRRMPGDMGADGINEGLMLQISLGTEAKLVQLAASYQVPVAEVVLVLSETDDLGVGYIMTRISGEALPGRILRLGQYVEARKKLAYQSGEALAKIHQISLNELPDSVTDLNLETTLDRCQMALDNYGNVSPVHQLALNWLKENQPVDSERCLVHGDFRNGNLMVDEDGLAAVLDWELAHVGYAAEDLGYLCANVWRFGRSDKPVGGFGDYDDLLAGYCSIAGSSPTLEEIHYWEVYGALSWGVCCQSMLEMYRSGADRTLERAAIGRRMSESEIDLLLLLEAKIQRSDVLLAR